MKLKKILSDASQLLGIDESDKANQKILFRCANLVMANLASNHFDYIELQNFAVTDGKIKYINFKKTFLKIKSVSCPYELFIDYICVPNGHVTVEYACIPEFKSPNSIVSINQSLLLYGILNEYASISGLVDEAKLYGQKFEQLLFGTKETGKSRRLP